MAWNDKVRQGMMYEDINSIKNYNLARIERDKIDDFFLHFHGSPAVCRCRCRCNVYNLLWSLGPSEKRVLELVEGCRCRDERVRYVSIQLASVATKCCARACHVEKDQFTCSENKNSADGAFPPKKHLRLYTWSSFGMSWVHFCSVRDTEEQKDVNSWYSLLN